MRPLAFLVLLLAVTVLGCSSSPASPEFPSGAVRINGTVQRFALEGGFWAVRGDDGVTYDPMTALASAFQREGMTVTMVAKIRTDVASIHMVGPVVEILEITELK